ncbi:MAG: thioredoxin family protein, partial [Crocinitomicaceae bacterium]|nr:thioredoxin family protein [Crocinitomicaceae bacterium]
MNKISLFLSSIILVLTSFSNAQDLKTLKIGEKAPMHDVKMKNVDGRPVSIGDVNNQNGYIVIFSCNTCPFVVGGSSFAGWEKDYNEIVSKANAAGVGVVFVNSNEAKRNDGDSMDDMAQRFKEKGYT